MIAADVDAQPVARPLTRREVEVLALIADGLTAAQIARRLSISYRTVQTHTQNAYQKLGATCGAHAVAIAVRCGAIRLHTAPDGCPLCGCDGTHTTRRAS